MQSYRTRLANKIFILPFITSILILVNSAVLSESSNQTLPTQNNINKTAQQSFPINFYSDNTTMDGNSREIKNCGNARINQGDINLLADCLVAKKGEQGDYEYFKATGKPASVEIFDSVKKEYLYLTANNIFYDVLKRNFTATGTADLVLSSGKNSELSPDRLNIRSNEIVINNASEKRRMIEATGAPVNLDIRSEGNIELNAKSLYLSYSTETNELNLLNKVEAELSLGKITAGEFKYNHRTKKSSFKKAKDKQIEIVQNPKNESDSDLVPQEKEKQ